MGVQLDGVTLNGERARRRLTAILAADIAGYSREAAGAAGTRLSLRPLFFEGQTFVHSLGAIAPRDGGRLSWLFEISRSEAITLSSLRNAGTHNHRRWFEQKPLAHGAKTRGRGVWVPAFAGTTRFWICRRCEEQRDEARLARNHSCDACARRSATSFAVSFDPLAPKRAVT